MILSIITINYNNASGLSKTLNSITNQTYKCFEHIIIDGGSIDDSISIIKNYASSNDYCVNWISEKDNGIYNAMNKGISIASGDYIQFLNSGDMLAENNVVERMTNELIRLNSTLNEAVPILYGNMIKDFGRNKLTKDSGYSNNINPQSFLYFYKGTLNHDSAYIRRNLFDKYGKYNEKMKICSDWEWYIKSIVFGQEHTYYTDIDVSIFDMYGISESNGKNKDIISYERRNYLESVISPAILNDYDNYTSPILTYLRLEKHHVWPFIVFIERILFKLEKWKIIK